MRLITSLRERVTRGVSLLPPGLIRAVGRLQFKIPVGGRLIGLVGRKFLAGQGRIRHGAGAGLRFDATGGFAGYVLGTSEPLEQEALAGLLKPGHVFYDIGANVGFYSTIAARIVGPAGRVYAFEPSPEMAAAVRRNAALNGFENVEVIEMAAGERAGRGTFVRGDVEPNVAVRPDGAGEVEVVAVDVLSGLRPPNVVMIDVEGAEVAVLRGMMRTIREHRPAVMCEVHWLVREFDEARAEIAAMGYDCRTLEGFPFPTSPKHYHALMIPR